MIERRLGEIPTFENRRESIEKVDKKTRYKQIYKELKEKRKYDKKY